MSTKRYLVLSAAVGAGHLRAAEAVELALKQLNPDAIVRNVDALTLTNAGFRKVYGEAYIDFVNKAPHMLGYFYDLLDKPRRADSKRDALRRSVNELNLGALIELLQSEPWDAVINTHFLPAEILAGLKKKRKCMVKQMTVTTDFETHRLWANQPCEQYTTATDEGRLYLAHWGVPVDTIQVTGIPIHPVFAKEKSRKECMAKQNLDGDRPIVLQSGGGFGVGPVEQIYRELLAVDRSLEIVVITGRNAAAKAKLDKIEVPRRHLSRIIGFTTEIDELMGAADLVVGKPGGLTTSESLARGAPMAIINPIPGQESRNSDWLLENGAAIKINNLATLAYKLEKVLSNKDELKRLKANARALGKPCAAFDVAEIAMNL